MSQQLHRRNPSNESIDPVISTTTTTTVASSPALTPDKRKGTKKGMHHHHHHNNQDNGDVEAASSPGSGSKLKAKNSSLNLDAGGGTSNGNGSSSANNGTQNHGSHSKSSASALTAAGWKAVTACINYSFCSVSMILVNKSLASSYNHLIAGDLNVLLVVFQAVVAVICVETCKHAGWIERYPALTWDITRAWAPVNLLFCAMLFTGMASLQTNSVPMVTVFKNITNVLTTVGDYFFFGSKPEALVIAAFGIMLFGAVAAARNDMTISSAGLFWMGANCVATAGYVLYMNHVTKHVQLTKFGMVHVNNVLCIAFLLPIAMMRGEVATYLDSDDIHTADYLFKNIFAGFIGFFLNFASLSCVQATGPTTYAIVGSLNKIPVAFLGYVLFDSVISYDTWCYIGVSMCGGFLYSYAQLQKSRKGHKK